MQVSQFRAEFVALYPPITTVTQRSTILKNIMENKKNIMEKPPLADWLLNRLCLWNIRPKFGKKFFKGTVVRGWYIPTSGEETIFWVCPEDRGVVGVKYISASGKGVQPTLFSPDLGVVKNLHKEIPENLIATLDREGLALTEGWKAAVALCAAGIPTSTTGGCASGAASVSVLKSWGISPSLVRYIFADTDIIHNPNVTRGYQNLVEACAQDGSTAPKVLVYPPQQWIDNLGDLVIEKTSPDDWINEGDDITIILEKTKMLNVQSVQQYHDKIVSQTYTEKKSISISRGTANQEANTWLFNIFKNKLMYLSSTKQYFFFNGVHWESFDTQGILDLIVSTTPNIRWSYTTLENSLKLVAPKFLRSPDDVLAQFSTRRYIGFENGAWDVQTCTLQPHKPDQYLGGVHPVHYLFGISGNTNIKKICPKIATWIIERTNHVEIYANILMSFLFLAILDARDPERFLFLSGYSASGKSTYLKLLQKMVPDNKTYVGTAKKNAGFL